MLLHNFVNAIDTLKYKYNGKLYIEIIKRIRTSNGNKKYYIGINQSTVFGSH